MPSVKYLADHIRVCTTQVACDGVTLLRSREMCGACEKAMKRRAAAKPTALRGERYIEYESEKKRKGA
jgi:hypothetical protein